MAITGRLVEWSDCGPDQSPPCIAFEGELSKDDVEAIREWWKRQYTGINPKPAAKLHIPQPATESRGWSAVPPPPPRAPLSRMVVEGALRWKYCPKCSNTMLYKWWLFGQLKCAHPECGYVAGSELPKPPRPAPPMPKVMELMRRNAELDDGRDTS